MKTLEHNRFPEKANIMNKFQPRRAMVWAPAAALLVLLGACNFDVENPGPTADSFLDSLVAHDAVTAGARRDLAIAMQNITYWGAAMTFEINPAGSTGSYGIPSYIQAGRFDEFDSGDWNVTQRARWVAENAYDRFERALAAIDGAPALASYELAAWTRLYAGYANRLLGENFCQVTFNGGPVEAHTAAFQRAEQYFSDAITIGTAAGNTEIVTAARAGRASVRANLATYGLASWADAASDASSVANDFVFAIPYSTQQQSQFNFIHFANGNEPYRAHTVWGTFYEDYYTSTGDPRVAWEVGNCPDCPDPLNPTGDAAVDKFGGQVPWYPQMKFDQRDSGINLSSGWEMRLIEAEAELAGGNFVTAAAFMNQRRDTDLGLTPVAPTTLSEGWDALKAERAFELWLEGRRMGDIRRWLDNAVDGALHDVVFWDSNGDLTKEVTESVVNNHRAFPIGLSERETNENVPIAVSYCQ